MYAFSRWELVCSFVFIFEQVRIWSKSVTALLVMPVHPLLFDCGIDREVHKVMTKFPVLKCKHAQKIISRDFYLRHG